MESYVGQSSHGTRNDTEGLNRIGYSKYLQDIFQLILLMFVSVVRKGGTSLRYLGGLGLSL